MPRVLISTEILRDQTGPHTEILSQAGFEIVFPKNHKLGRGVCGYEETIEELHGVHAVLAGAEYMTAETFSAVPSLRVIARTGVGYDRIDVAAATRHDVLLTITPTANHAAVAEHAFALLFAISKRVVTGDRDTRAGQWPRELTQPIRGKTIGLLGMGRTGKSMANRAQAFGMTVIAHDPFACGDYARSHNIELVDLITLAERCDVLSIHCPDIEATRGVVDQTLLNRMKPTAILINTARGPIVNETDLIDALRRGQIQAAGLDVYEAEPPASDKPFFELENVVLTPHSAGGEQLAMRDMAIESAQCIVSLFAGHWPEGAVVNDQLRSSWKW